MIWRYWPISDLQNELGENLLESIGEILPMIDEDGKAIFFETNKDSLVKLLCAFTKESYFRSKHSLEKCLEFLPQDIFVGFLKKLELDASENTDQTRALISKKILAGSKSYEIFLDYFALPNRFNPTKAKSKPSDFVVAPASNSNPISITRPYRVLKDYQNRIFSDACSLLEAPMSRLLIQMPTGSGKTRTSMELISQFINNGDEDSPQVFWLANSTELCEQAISCFVEVWEHVGTKPVQVQRMWGQHSKSLESEPKTSAKFIVGGFQGLWQALSQSDPSTSNILNETSLLVIDEAHIAVAKTYKEVISEIIRRSDCRVIGLTATPGRTVTEETTELAALFHSSILALQDPSKMFPNVIAYLRSKGVLSNVTYEVLEIENGIQLNQSMAQEVSNSTEFSASILKQVGLLNFRNAQILLRIIPHLKNGSRALLFAPSVEASQFITSMLTFLGINAAHIDGSIAPTTRDSLIEQYKKGEIQIICNYGVLATGFDAPSTDLLCIARPTKSPVLYSQMLGRGLRGPAVGGTPTCNIIEVRDTYLTMGLQDELYQFFDDFWEAD